MTFERTTDLDLVRQIMTHPRVYPWIGDDFAPPVEEFIPSDDPRLWYVLVRGAQGELLGMLQFGAISAVLWEAHISMLPAGWGRAVSALAGGFRWLFDHTGAMRIMGTIPVSNRCACRLALRAGMEPFGHNPDSFFRHGKLHDQILFGISRGA